MPGDESFKYFSIVVIRKTVESMGPHNFSSVLKQSREICQSSISIIYSKNLLFEYLFVLSNQFQTLFVVPSTIDKS